MNLQICFAWEIYSTGGSPQGEPWHDAREGCSDQSQWWWMRNAARSFRQQQAHFDVSRVARQPALCAAAECVTYTWCAVHTTMDFSICMHGRPNLWQRTTAKWDFAGRRAFNFGRPVRIFAPLSSHIHKSCEISAVPLLCTAKIAAPGETFSGFGIHFAWVTSSFQSGGTRRDLMAFFFVHLLQSEFDYLTEMGFCLGSSAKQMNLKIYTHTLNLMSK
jgi:hypothetical protein